MQAMVDANPGGRYRLPGSAGSPVTLYVGGTSLRMKGNGWVLEGGGTAIDGGGTGGTTLQWAPGATGIITLNSEGQGTIRYLNLCGSERFTGAERGIWPDAIMPNFTDHTGVNIFRRDIKSMSRRDNVVTVQVDTYIMHATNFSAAMCTAAM
jgi:hypothetical protein